MTGIRADEPNRTGRAIRIAGSFLCFGFIGWKLEFDKIVDLVAHPNWPFLLLCVALTPPLILTSVWRWLAMEIWSRVVFRALSSETMEDTEWSEAPRRRHRWRRVRGRSQETCRLSRSVKHNS